MASRSNSCSPHSSRCSSYGDEWGTPSSSGQSSAAKVHATIRKYRLRQQLENLRRFVFELFKHRFWSHFRKQQVVHCYATFYGTLSFDIPPFPLSCCLSLLSFSIYVLCRPQTLFTPAAIWQWLAFYAPMQNLGVGV